MAAPNVAPNVAPASNWEQFVARTGAKGAKGSVRCPCHDDRVASLSYKRDGDDVLLFCFGGCRAGDVRTALGLTFRFRRAPWQAPNASPVPHRRVVAQYAYRDLAGDVVAVKRRWEPKRFDWLTLRPDGEFQPGFPEGMTQAQVPLYRLPECAGAARAGDVVFWVEGEKDADALHALGLAGTCNPEGASGAASSYDPTRVVGLFPPNTLWCLIPDNDDAGRQHARRLADALAPTFPVVTVLELPELPPKGDVSDWLALRRAAGADTDALASTLRQLAAHAPPVVVGPVPEVADTDALEERAGMLAGQGWPAGTVDAVARRQVAASLARQRAGLSLAERMALETTDPTLREIYLRLAVP